MIDLKFKAKKKRVGNSFMVIIPKPISDLLDQNKDYFYTISECEDLEKNTY